MTAIFVGSQKALTCVRANWEQSEIDPGALPTAPLAPPPLSLPAGCGRQGDVIRVVHVLCLQTFIVCSIAVLVQFASQSFGVRYVYASCIDSHCIQCGGSPHSSHRRIIGSQSFAFRLRVYYECAPQHTSRPAVRVSFSDAYLTCYNVISV